MKDTYTKIIHTFSLPFKSEGNLLFLELLHFLRFSWGMTSCWETSFYSQPNSVAKQLNGYKEQENRSMTAPKVALLNRESWHYENHCLMLGHFALSMELLPHSYQTLHQIIGVNPSHFHQIIKECILLNARYQRETFTSGNDGQRKEYYWKEWEII